MLKKLLNKWEDMEFDDGEILVSVGRKEEGGSSSSTQTFNLKLSTWDSTTFLFDHSLHFHIPQSLSTRSVGVGVTPSPVKK